MWGPATLVTRAASQENRWELNKSSCLELSEQGVYLRHMTGDLGVDRHAGSRRPPLGTTPRRPPHPSPGRRPAPVTCSLGTEGFTRLTANSPKPGSCWEGNGEPRQREKPAAREEPVKTASWEEAHVVQPQSPGTRGSEPALGKGREYMRGAGGSLKALCLFGSSFVPGQLSPLPGSTRGRRAADRWSERAARLSRRAVGTE